MQEPSVIFQDEDIRVIDKPAGMTVNRSDTTKSELTLQDWLEEKFLKDYEKPTGAPESDFYTRAGIVHRLDRETSGVLITARTKEAFEELQRQFKERIVKKKYQALAHGEIVPHEGEINVPVGRLTFNRKRFGIVAGGRPAVTKYQVVNVFKSPYGKTKEKLSLVELYPETGRTHQIRVHLKYLNHPIFADELYAGRKVAREDRLYVSRCFLHASQISFQHPVSGKLISFNSPLPEILQNFLQLLESVS